MSPSGLPRWDSDCKPVCPMSQLNPIYTAANCRPAYQLNWSLSIFWRGPAVESSAWLTELKEATERDNVRILEYRQKQSHVSQFLLSTAPEVAPDAAIRSVKGRLQYLVRAVSPRAFKRNYSIHSIGSARGDVVVKYVANQLSHHVMADARVQALVAALQVIDKQGDPFRPRRSSHGEFSYNLHLVFVNKDRFSDVRTDRLAAARDMVIAAAGKHGHIVHSFRILSEHIHLALGCQISESPADVAISYMNNVAFVHGMRPILEYGYYAGTFGKYNLGAVRNSFRPSQSALHGGKPRADEGVAEPS